MAPERFEGTVDARSDIYGLGMTLYELITLKHPLGRGEPRGLVNRISDVEPLRPGRIDARIPRDLETIIVKSIEKQPDSRYQTAVAFADDLRRFLSDQPVAARPISPVERFSRWCRSNPVLASSVSIAFMALLATAGMLWLLTIHQLNAKRELICEQRATNKALEIAESRRREAELFSSQISLNRGLQLLAQKQIHRGLVWLTRAWETAPEDDVKLRHVILTNLALWESSTVKLNGILRSECRPEIVRFSPQGDLFVCCSQGDRQRPGRFQIWSVKTHRPIGPVVETEYAITDAIFSPNASRLVTVGLATQIWQTQDSTAIGDPIYGAMAIVFSDDGANLIGAGTSANIYDSITGTVIRQLPLQVAPGRILAAAVSPTGQTAATAHTDQLVRVWDRTTGGLIFSLPADKVRKLAFSPDGTILAIKKALRLELWNWESGSLTSLSFSTSIVTGRTTSSRTTRHSLTRTEDTN